jgi:aminoglycoside phosphotransferase
MNFNYNLTSKVLNFIENSNLDEIKIGCSDSQVVRIEKEHLTYYLKIAKKGMLTSEYEKLKWLEGKLKVPKVVLYDNSIDTEFLITEEIPGMMLCSEEYEKNIDKSLKIIAEAFKNIYSVCINDCPFDVSISYKLSLVEENLRNNLIQEENVSKEVLDKFESLENILKFLKENKFESELCFSHGDTSLPNIFAVENNFSGFIDVGECGIADKWFDLAICERSIKRNYGEEYISKFYEELNIIPDREKVDYYLLMMELYL